MKFPCSNCGSRNWPRLGTTCPLCWGDPEESYETTTTTRQPRESRQGMFILNPPPSSPRPKEMHPRPMEQETPRRDGGGTETAG